MAHRERKQLNFSTIVDFPSQNRVSFLSHSDKKDPQLRLRVLFCAGAGRIRTGRPSADGKKQSCGLFFRPRLANPPAPTKKLWKRCCRSFFSLLYRTKSTKAMTDFQSAFYRDVRLLPGGWIFLLPTFSAAFRMLRQYRIILSAAAAGAVLEPLGGNCAVLP